MSYMMPAQACAQLLSLIVLATAARWYLVPWLKNRTRADALIALLWVHVFRYVALQVFSAQRDGFPISDSGAMRSEEHTSELQSRRDLVCRLLLEKKKQK